MDQRTSPLITVLLKTAIPGVILFSGAVLTGTWLLPGYDWISQYISESYATGTPYGSLLRWGGFIPAGFLFSLFSIGGMLHFKRNKTVKIGFLLLCVFYGIATIIVSLFPCDEGCNIQMADPSQAQLIHQFAGLLTYGFTPFSMLLIGYGLKNDPTYDHFQKRSYFLGILAYLLILLLFSQPTGNYIGLYQRFIESIFFIWIIQCQLKLGKEVLR